MSKKVQFILRSSDINNLGYSSTSPFAPIERTSDFIGLNGRINRWQSNITWNNINLRGLLGDLYDVNASYNLKLESITFGLTSNLSFYSTVENNKSFNIFMSGLPFQRSYSSSLQLYNENMIASVRLPNGTQSYIYNYSNNETTFDLSNNNHIENVNINIQFRDLLLNSTEPIGGTNTHAYPNSQFVFSIYKI
jgi:hypothetical protein